MNTPTPTAPAPDIAGIQNQQLSTNQQAVPVPMVWGTRKVSVTWISPILNLKTYDIDSDQKKGGNQKGYVGAFAGVFGFGQHHSIVGILKDGKSIYPTAKVWALGGTIDHTKLYLYNSVVWKSLDGANYTSTQDNAPDGLNGAAHWTEYEFVSSGDSDTITTSFGDVVIYWGTSTQTADALLQAAGNNLHQAHPDYKRIGYLLSRKFTFGAARPSAPDIGVIVRRAPEQTIVTGGPAGLVDGQANVAAIVAEILTSPNCLGLSTTLVDAVSFQATADTLHANASITGVSKLIDSQDTFRDVIEELLETVDAYLRYNPSTKKIEMGLYSHGALPAAYTALGFDDLVSPFKPTTAGWSKSVNRMMVNFTDRAYAFNTVSEGASALSWFSVLGEVRTKSIDRPSVTRRVQARALAAEALRTFGKPPMTGEVEVRREKGWNCRPGSYVQLPVQLEPDDADALKFFRVTRRVIPRTGPMRLTIQGENALAPMPYTPGVPAVLAIDDSVAAVVNARVMEAPSQLTGVAGEVIVLAERPDTVTKGFDVYFDTNTGSYNKIGTMTGWALRATLRANVATGDTTIQITVPNQADTSLAGVSPGALAANNDSLLCVLVQPAAAGQILENSGGYPRVEICSISAQALVSGSDYNLTVLRARQGTAANTFSKDGTGITGAAAAEVWIVERDFIAGFYHASFETLRDNRINNVVPYLGKFRLVTYTQTAQRDLADCTDISFQFPAVVSSSITGFLYHGYPPDTLDPVNYSVTVSLSPSTPPPVTYPIWLKAFAPTPVLTRYAFYLTSPLSSTPTLLRTATLSTPADTFTTTYVPVSLSTDGIYKLQVYIWDTKGNVVQRTVVITVIRTLGVGGSTPPDKVGTPVWMYGDVPLGATERASFGLITALAPSTEATVYWSSRFSVDGETWSDWTAWVDQSLTPAVHSLLGIADSANQAIMQEFRAYATQGGMDDSDIATVHFDDFTPVTG